MNIRKHIPNLFTCSNLLCGCLGIAHIFQDNILIAASFIWIGAAFDFLDGFAARVLNVNSIIGKELDSLADMITFGLLPATIFYYLIDGMGHNTVAYSGFIFAVFTALRLAKFNVSDAQTDQFTGLPSPSAAFAVSALPFYYHSDQLSQFITPWSLIIITILLSALMVSTLQLYSLKINTLSWKKDKWKIICGAISLILIITYKVFALPLIIITYIITSILNNIGGSRHQTR